jgi:hypothetical protein
MGRSCGIDTPINETVLSLVQALERRARIAEAFTLGANKAKTRI